MCVFIYGISRNLLSIYKCFTLICFVHNLIVLLLNETNEFWWSVYLQTYFCTVYIIGNCCSAERERILAMDRGQIDSVITCSSSSSLMTASH